MIANNQKPEQQTTTPSADTTPLGRAISSGLQGDALAKHLASEIGLAYLENLDGHTPSARYLQRIPIDFSRRHGVLGLATDQVGTLTLAVSDPMNGQAVDIVGRWLKVNIKLLVVPEDVLRRAIDTAYQTKTQATQDAIERLDPASVEDALNQVASNDDLLDDAGRAPVIRLANGLLFEAVQQMASDVHIQPYEDQLVIRYRIDGVLFDAHQLPKSVQGELISRLKVMSHMDIAEKRLPQDGRATVQVGDRVIDLRIASLPASHGERVVIRLLDKSARQYNLGDLGMDGDALARFRRLIGVEHGLVLVTGPTGSGKSTTLYAALQEMDAQSLNILTLEDPIEYQLPGVSQTQINEKKGMSFAKGLRNILRQDPDVIMVGEIRDHETAVMAIQSALTGHLVFSTLHTNDAASAVTRLLDLGIEPYLVASSLVGVLAQRLVRSVCSNCGQWDTTDPQSLIALGLTADEAAHQSKLFAGNGCAACRHTGYRGRTGLFELFPMDGQSRRLITDRATASDLKTHAISHGMTTLRGFGLDCAQKGLTSLEEVLRVTARSTSEELD